MDNMARIYRRPHPDLLADGLATMGQRKAPAAVSGRAGLHWEKENQVEMLDGIETQHDLRYQNPWAYGSMTHSDYR